MLSRPNRLTSKADIENVKKNGRAFRSESFTVLALSRKDKDPSRFVFVVSSKVAPLANKRSYIKRALSEAVRQNVTRISDGHDFVFLANQNSAKKYMNELMPEVVEALKKAAIFK
jgi:ribonuclease P protein component